MSKKSIGEIIINGIASFVDDVKEDPGTYVAAIMGYVFGHHRGVKDATRKFDKDYTVRIYDQYGTLEKVVPYREYNKYLKKNGIYSAEFTSMADAKEAISLLNDYKRFKSNKPYYGGGETK